MRKTAYLIITATVVLISSLAIYQISKTDVPNSKVSTGLFAERGDEKEEGGYKRWLYEWKMLHDPATGEIPRGIRQKENALLNAIQRKQKMAGFRQTINNSYTAAGPSQNGGRTRALAYDIRNNNIMLAGGISGGIFRSTDAGSTWNHVTTDTSMLRNVSCLAQDPRPGFQDIWYAGTGELLGASAGYPSFSIATGNGILKSTNNGLTWSKVSITAGSTYKEILDNVFDMIFNIQVDNRGHVYFATFNYIFVSTDGFTAPGSSTFGFVLGVNDRVNRFPIWQPT